MAKHEYQRDPSLKLPLTPASEAIASVIPKDVLRNLCNPLVRRHIVPRRHRTYTC